MQGMIDTKAGFLLACTTACSPGPPGWRRVSGRWWATTAVRAGKAGPAWDAEYGRAVGRWLQHWGGLPGLRLALHRPWNHRVYEAHPGEDQSPFRHLISVVVRVGLLTEKEIRATTLVDAIGTENIGGEVTNKGSRIAASLAHPIGALPGSVGAGAEEHGHQAVVAGVP